MTRPHIRPTVEPHSSCWKQDRTISSGFIGDVRYCHHQKIQILTKVPPNAGMAGPGTHWWKDVSKFWNPKQYKLAQQALSK